MFLKLISFIILLSGALAIAISRLILGVHSVDQVIYGFTLGLWCLAYFLIYWKPIIEDNLLTIRYRLLSDNQVSWMLLRIFLFCVFLMVAVASSAYAFTNNFALQIDHAAAIKKLKNNFT